MQAKAESWTSTHTIADGRLHCDGSLARPHGMVFVGDRGAK
jgi:hypothetical protein